MCAYSYVAHYIMIGAEGGEGEEVKRYIIIYACMLYYTWRNTGAAVKLACLHFIGASWISMQDVSIPLDAICLVCAGLAAKPRKCACVLGYCCAVAEPLK